MNSHKHSFTTEQIDDGRDGHRILCCDGAMTAKLTDNLSRPLGKTFVNHDGQECWIVLVVILAGSGGCRKIPYPTHCSSSSSSSSSVAMTMPHVVRPPPLAVLFTARCLGDNIATAVFTASSFSPHPLYGEMSHRAVQRLLS